MTELSPIKLRQMALAAGIGSALEWYDFFLYGLASALVFGPLFFPTYDPATGTLASFATFGAGFLARPFGGLVFGHFGDRFGRKPMLVATMILVGGSTFLIGLLPTYSQAGIWAPLMLIGLRLVQGFGAGAEYSGAVVMAVEFAPDGKRGLYGAFAPMGTQSGMTLAAVTFWLLGTMGKDDVLAWGWRIPFLLSLLLLGLGVYIRAKVTETPVFQEARRLRPALKIPALEAIRRHPRNFLVVVGARFAENALGYLYPVFGVSYLAATLHMSPGMPVLAVVCGGLSLVFGVLFFSRLSDRIGRRPVYIFGALFSAVWVFPFFLLADSRDPWLIILAFVLAMGVGVSAMFGPQAAYFAELFGPRLRYSGFAFARETGSILAGGPAPLIAGLLVAWMGGRPWGVCLYVIGLCAITIFAVWCGPETYKSDIRADDVEDRPQVAAPAPLLVPTRPAA
ncbi:MAG TPA: MFS transporter [Rhizomicrobium sp.]|nr:MFS transporter [Rhizomicrobium sp.]